MFRMLLPKEVCFFDYFERLAVMIKEACDGFLRLAEGKTDNVTQASAIKEIEHQADDVTHACIEELNKTFITPIDRMDIHALIKRLDDVVDSVDASMSRISLYELTEIRTEAKQLAEVLMKAALEIEIALKGLRRMSNIEHLKKHMIAIHALENEGDMILKSALVRLFNEEQQNPVLIIKWKEIFERLERATDRCEDVANIIEKIVLEAS
ncbi:MAG: DUF47 domain-containing protein [Candidatus Hydrogenedentes bacterium]|nr:DUF47 domain-containing protein [Candidatus Hydrogenedentota bacterium]